eukprot:scaffold177_cov334-Pavlova_lutheri.AAC.71
MTKAVLDVFFLHQPQALLQARWQRVGVALHVFPGFLSDRGRGFGHVCCGSTALRHRSSDASPRRFGVGPRARLVRASDDVQAGSHHEGRRQGGVGDLPALPRGGFHRHVARVCAFGARTWTWRTCHRCLRRRGSIHRCRYRYLGEKISIETGVGPEPVLDAHRRESDPKKGNGSGGSSRRGMDVQRTLWWPNGTSSFPREWMEPMGSHGGPAKHMKAPVHGSTSISA